MNLTPVFSLLGRTEGTARGRGYDETYDYGKYVPAGSKPLTQMTVKQVQALQAKMLKAKAASTAVGMYQFIDSTLKRLIARLGIEESAKFDAALQDRLCAELLDERGLKAWLNGTVTTTALVNNLAREWASLPTTTGRSFYAPHQNAACNVNEVIRALTEVKAAQ